MGVSLVQWLKPGTVLLAAGARLARHLAQRHAAECRALGMEVWETPEILTFGAWLSTLWQEAVEVGADRRLLLVPGQEAALWERAVLDAGREMQLLPATATAGLARDAWTLWHGWQLPAHEIKKGAHEDVDTFLGWAALFDDACRTHRWLDNARLPDALAELIADKRIRLPARIVLCGFDDVTPQQSRLFELLRGAGCTVETLPSDDIEAKAVRVAFASAEEEMSAAAHWTRGLLDANPAIRVGILVPDLARDGRSIRRVFDGALMPQTLLPGQAETARPYNMSLGEPLSMQHAIDTAFSILDLATGDISGVKLSALLRSPYIVGSEAEFSRRALLDVELRRAGDAQVSLAALSRILQRHDTAYSCPIFAARLARFSESCSALDNPRKPSQWLTVFAQLLAALGWPGDRVQSSTEYQLIEKWRELLGQFGALSAVLPPLRYGDALARLRRLAQETLFQRETPETPVQILGVLEASGFEFDAAWALGLHDEVWPSAPRPSPFLPTALQRVRRLPHSSAERELEFCTRITRRLLRSATQAVVSHPSLEEDRDLRPSPLIRSLPLAETKDLSIPALPSYRERIRTAAKLETFVDTQGPTVADGTPVSGGTRLFKTQSDCPARAFAEFRLGAGEFPQVAPGLSAADRGTLVHRVFGRLWREIDSHEALVAMPAPTLSERVQTWVSDEVEQYRRQRPQTLTARVFALECERLVALAHEWLVLERQRAPFTVRSEEKQAVLVVQGLAVKARIDRVDELAGGELVVIDYKTGDVSIKDWFGQRPAEPQLPLYALYAVPRERVGALLYAKLRRGETEFSGIARVAAVAPDVELFGETKLAAMGSWTELFTQWEKNLIELAREFREGEAAVRPRERRVCDLCHLHAFCRVYDRRARLAAAEGENGD